MWLKEGQKPDVFWNGVQDFFLFFYILSLCLSSPAGNGLLLVAKNMPLPIAVHRSHIFQSIARQEERHHFVKNTMFLEHHVDTCCFYDGVEGNALELHWTSLEQNMFIKNLPTWVNLSLTHWLGLLLISIIYNRLASRTETNSEKIYKSSEFD